MDSWLQHKEIEAFINKSLPEEEMKALTTKLVIDSKFAEQVNLYKEANEVIIDNELIQLQKKWSTWKTELDLKKGNHNINKWTSITNIISGLALLTTIALGLRWGSSAKDSLPHTTEIDEISKIETQCSTDSSSDAGDHQLVESKSKANSNTTFQSHATHPILMVPPFQLEQLKATLLFEATLPKVELLQLPISSLPCKEEVSLVINFGGSCNNTQQGYISISSTDPSILGYSINGGDTFNKTNSYLHLSNGTYNIAVISAEGCIYPYGEIRLEENEDCKKNPSIIVQPAIGLTWEPKIEIGKTAQLSIFDKFGNIVFNRQISPSFDWTGVSDTNSPLPMGAYSFILYYNNSIQEKGMITLMR